MISIALRQTLRSVRDAAASESDSRLDSRVKSAKILPSFSGDPLEWTHFREIYRDSTELCGFTNRENLDRLFKALHGKARDAVMTLFASSGNADAVMETLALHFGNKSAVAERILTEIRELPKLEARALHIAQFATKVRNAVSALKSLNLSEYLRSPDLMRSVWSKLPDEIKYAFNRHVREKRVNASNTSNVSLSSDTSSFEELAEFLYGEAECAQISGALDWETAPSAIFSAPSRPPARPAVKAPYVSDNKRQANHGRSAVVCANFEPSDDRDVMEVDSVRDACLHCGRTEHEVRECQEFAKESAKRRWHFAKRRRLCFKCLRHGHAQYRCEEKKVCDVCQSPHHTLIHLSKNEWAEMNRGRGVRNEKRSPRSAGPRDDRKASQ